MMWYVIAVLGIVILSIICYMLYRIGYILQGIDKERLTVPGSSRTRKGSVPDWKMSKPEMDIGVRVEEEVEHSITSKSNTTGAVDAQALRKALKKR